MVDRWTAGLTALAEVAGLSFKEAASLSFQQIHYLSEMGRFRELLLRAKMTAIKHKPAFRR